MAKSDVVVPFDEITSMVAELGRQEIEFRERAGVLRAIQRSPDLAASLPLSPGTGNAAIDSLGRAAASMDESARRAASTARVLSTVVGSYQLLDQALAHGTFIAASRQPAATPQVSAQPVSVQTIAMPATDDTDGDDTDSSGGVKSRFSGINTDSPVLGDILGDLTGWCADVIGGVGSAVTVAGVAAGSLVGGILAEEALSLVKATVNLEDFHTLGWWSLIDPSNVGAVIGESLQTFDLSRALEFSFHGLEGQIGVLKDMGMYDGMVSSIISGVAALGGFDRRGSETWGDPDWVIPSDAPGEPVGSGSSIPEIDWEKRLDDYRKNVLGSTGASYDSEQPIIDVESLLLRAGELDYLGKGDEAQIETLLVEGPPMSLTVIIPSTQEWSPWGSGVPNDLYGNLSAMSGNASDLQILAQHAIDARLAELPESMRSEVEIMTVGFSQGGIVAAAIAASGQYNVTQVVTAGSPIAGYVKDMPEGIKILSLEQLGDPVPQLDGSPNPVRDGVTTVRVPDAEQPGEKDPLVSHDIFRYAKVAEGLDPQSESAQAIAKFLGTGEDQSPHRYYGQR